MSRLYSNASQLTYRIDKFRGVNEAAEGGVNLKVGEAARMQDYRITDDGGLKVRGGFKHMFGHMSGTIQNAVRYMASGIVQGVEMIIALSGDKVYAIDTPENFDYEEIGTLSTSEGNACVFFFGGNAYILDGNKYYRYDRVTFTEVDGYIPTVMIAAAPDGSGTTYEQINKLTTKRKARYNADGASTDYLIPEVGVVEILSVVVDGVEMTPTTDYTVAQSPGWNTRGVIKFVTAPNSGVNNIEVLYAISPAQCRWYSGVFLDNGVYNFGEGANVLSVTKVTALGNPIPLTGWQTLVSGTDYTIDGGTITITNPTLWSNIKVYYTIGDYRSEVTRMTMSETYNGAQDARVFLYGDGSYTALYSGLEENGRPTAEYFPDLNEMSVGDENVPITAMIRHRSRLLVFKPHAAYSVYYNPISLADSTMTAGFYVIPINRDVGCSVMGGACLVGNAVRTIDYNNIYEWKATNTSGNITADARNTEVVSNRVKRTVEEMDMSKAVLFYDNANHEFYCGESSHGIAVVQNTQADAWYIYHGIHFTSMVYAFQKVWIGDDIGRVFVLDNDETQDTFYVTVGGELKEEKYDIECDWESGSLDFGKPHYVKYTPSVWVTAVTAPEAKVGVIIRSDSEDSPVATDLDFSADGGRYAPKTRKARLKSRKFDYLKLYFATIDSGEHATILSAIIKVLADIPVKR